MVVTSRRGALKLGALTGLAGTSVSATLLSPESKLLDPFDVIRKHRLAPEDTITISRFPSILPIVRVVNGVVYYEGGKNGVKDGAKFAQDTELTKDLSAYTAALENCAALWLSSRGTNRSAIKRGYDLLRQWSLGGALADASSEQAKAHRRWNFTGIAIAYLALRGGMSGCDCKAIDSWMGKVGRACLDSAKTYHNNHLFWSGAAGICGAIAANDRDLFSNSLEVGVRGVGAIDKDGSLQAELERAQRSLGYHSFALTPLLIISEMALVNGYDLYSSNNGGIFRLASYVVARLKEDGNTSPIPSWPWIIARRTKSLSIWKLLPEAPRSDPFSGGRLDILFGP